MKKEPVHPIQRGLSGSWLAYLLAGLFLLVILVISRAFPEEKQFHVVQLKGHGSVINWSKSYHFSFSPAGTIEKGAILAERNDLLGLDDRYFRYPLDREDTIHINSGGDSLLFLNGKINSLIINQQEELLSWFRQYSPELLSHLESIVFNDTIPVSYIPYLKKIALDHPTVSLVFVDHDSMDIVADYLRKADFFQPKMVTIPVTDTSVPALTHWKNANTVFIVLNDSIIHNTLPALPAMKECILFGDEIDSMPAGFFKHNPQLNKLSLLTNRPFVELLAPLGHLDELVLNNSDSTPGSLATVPAHISVLIASGRFNEIERLTTLKRLRWLGLPDNTTQQAFNLLTSKLRKLQVLEIAGNKELTDLSTLRTLPDLRALVFIDTVTDKKTIPLLNKLRFLSLPDDSAEDSLFLKEMRKALPGTVVVANSGACLGSGWLLLMIPLTLVSGLFFYKKNSRHETTGQTYSD